jgi:hypothetical protein
MAPRDQGRQGRGQRNRRAGERGSQGQRYAPDAEPGGRAGWSEESEWEGEFGGDREQEQYGSGGYGGEYRRAPFRGEPYRRGEYRGDPYGGRYRDAPSPRDRYDVHGVRPSAERPRRREEETYGETQRWERTRPDMGGGYLGGAYAGGAFGGGGWGPGGFGTRGWSPEVWEGVAGSGHAPGWVGDLEHPVRARDYSGRGPKGYRRSNERITEDVCDALTRHPFIDASDITVRCEDGEVILSGTVDDRREKRLAEDAAERVSGVIEVRNEIRVNRPTGSGSPERWNRGSSQRRQPEERTREGERPEEERTRRGSSSSRNRSGAKR